MESLGDVLLDVAHLQRWLWEKQVLQSSWWPRFLLQLLFSLGKMQDQQAAKDAKLTFTANWGLVCAQECRQHLQLGLLRLGGIFGDVSPFTVWEGRNRWSAKMLALLCISKKTLGTLISVFTNQSWVTYGYVIHRRYVNSSREARVFFSCPWKFNSQISLGILPRLFELNASTGRILLLVDWGVHSEGSVLGSLEWGP